jgi:hypothetical protein
MCACVPIIELLREGIPLPLIQRQLGHSHLSTTGTYLQGISSEEIISTVHARRAPMMHASAGPCPVACNHAGPHDALPRPRQPYRPGPTIASCVSSSQPPLALAWQREWRAARNAGDCSPRTDHRTAEPVTIVPGPTEGRRVEKQ